MKNPSGLRKAYHKLCTEFYDISKPFACPEGVTFYVGVLKGVQSPILEAMRHLIKKAGLIHKTAHTGAVTLV